MKKTSVAIVLLLALLELAAQQTAEERGLRANGGFKELLRLVKTNKKENCLCQAGEYAVFSFQAGTGKTASLCISKRVTGRSGWLVYRFGTKNKTEFSYPSDTLNSFSHFTFMFYSRGGGKQNAGMELNALEFRNKGFVYKICDDYSAENGRKKRYLIVINNKTKTESVIKGTKNMIGGLYYLRGAGIVKYDPDRID